MALRIREETVKEKKEHQMLFLKSNLKIMRFRLANKKNILH